MLPGAFSTIMNRLIRRRASRTSQAFDLAGKIKVNFTQINLKANIKNFPRLFETQGSSKEGGRFHGMENSSKTQKAHQVILFPTPSG